MLSAIGAESIDDFFSPIPEADRFKGALRLPPPASEPEVIRELTAYASRNAAHRTDVQLCFAGGGLYPHHIPAAVDALSLRGEFATAYTPYQAELAQGTLTAIFEFQSIVAELFGTDFANASMYDGASAAAEAVLMARRLTKRGVTLLSGGLHPEYRETCETYCAGIDADGSGTVINIPLLSSGATDSAAVVNKLDTSVACVVIQTPNAWGVLEQIESIATAAHKVGALLVVACPEPLALGLLEAPGRLGADIVVGEGGGLASRPTLGAPGVGLFGTTGKKALRAMPGRLCGATVDADNNPGYVLTLSTREQHIRREKATSNICTNHGLYALRFTIHMSLLGRTGFEQLAQLVLNKACYAKQAIGSLDACEIATDHPTFNEFPVRLSGKGAREVVRECASAGIVPGVPLAQIDRTTSSDDVLLVAVNETHTKEDIDRLASALRHVS